MRGRATVSFTASLKPLSELGTWWFNGKISQILTISFDYEYDFTFEYRGNWVPVSVFIVVKIATMELSLSSSPSNAKSILSDNTGT